MAYIVDKAGGAALVRWRDNGKLRSRQFPTRDEAEAFARSFEAMRAVASTPGIPGWEDGRPDVFEAEDPRFSVANYLQSVIDRDKSLRPTSRTTYGHSLRNHIAPSPLGKADIRSVTADDVRAFWDGLNLGNGALRNVRQLLAKAFNAAVVEGIIDVSPMHRAQVKAPPKRREVEMVPLTAPEVERLAQHARSDRDRLLILLMAYAGLRAGEVAGLRTVDVDFGRNRLNVRQQVVQMRGGREVAPLKTRAARRTVPFPASVADELRAYIEAHPPGPGDLIFTGRDGGPIAHVGVNHAVVAAAKRANIGHVHAHQLRHTAVSLLIDDGANARAIQAFVGHSDIKMTLGTYGHLFDYGGDALALSMERRRQGTAGVHQPTAGASEG
jgi:integrase